MRPRACLTGNRPNGPPRAVRVCGHFGELLQGRLGGSGPVVLISLPCPVLAVTGRARPAPWPAIHWPTGCDRCLTPKQARRFLRTLGLRPPGRVALRAEMPAGGGAGASTAALVALARLAGWAGPPEALARACVATEGASDPLMHAAPERLLWASRLGRGQGRLPALPQVEILGGFLGAPHRTDPADDRFPDVADLAAEWRAGKARQAADAAMLSTESARRTLQLRGPADDPILEIARETGALGVVIAHTGSARGLIFPPGNVPDHAAAALQDAGAKRLVRFRAGDT